jgi:arsenate reductase
MPESDLHYLAKGKVEVFSAGIETHGVNPRAIAIMKEDGIDISEHTSNNVKEYEALDFDYVITVCDNAKENCPYFPAKVKSFHQNFPDPAKATGSEEQIMQKFREVRNMIRDFSTRFMAEHKIGS